MDYEVTECLPTLPIQYVELSELRRVPQNHSRANVKRKHGTAN